MSKAVAYLSVVPL